MKKIHRDYLDKTKSTIKVLIVEDSAVVQEFLLNILASDPKIHVIAVAKDGEEAVKIAAQKKIDVITMDINMPKMDGIEATRKIMESNPVPIVIVSANWNPSEVKTTFKAMEAGAIAIVQKPTGLGNPHFRETADELLQAVKLMSEIKVIRRWPKRNTNTPSLSIQERTSLQGKTQEGRIIAIGASTGGPVALKRLLSDLPKKFEVPIVIAQHIAKGFLQGMLDWLQTTCVLPLHIAKDGEYIQAGHVYFAPEEINMGLQSGGHIAFNTSATDHWHRPSVSFLFESVNKAYGSQAVGILLSGMGRDGAKELKDMKLHGAITITQDKESSVVFGMPGAAIEIDAAVHILSPEKMADLLVEVTKNNRGSSSEHLHE